MSELLRRARRLAGFGATLLWWRLDVATGLVEASWVDRRGVERSGREGGGS